MGSSLDISHQISAEFDSIGEADWNAELEAFRDATFYQGWAYAAVRCGQRRVSRMLLRERGRIVAMAQVRLHTTPILPYGIAYVHWGPVWRRTAHPYHVSIFRNALAALKAEFVERRRLTLRVFPPVYGCEPEMASVREALLDAGFSGGHRPARLLLIDIRPPLEDLRRGLDKKWRNALVGGEKSGLSLVYGSDDHLFELYASIHQEMRTRKQLTIDDGLAHVRRVIPQLSEWLRPLVVLATHNEEPVAGAVLSTSGKRAIYMFGAISNAGMRLKASNLVQWHCISILKSMGIEHYDLSGISPEANPGTYAFKAGLCGKNGVATEMSAFSAPSGLLNCAVVRAGELFRAALAR